MEFRSRDQIFAYKVNSKTKQQAAQLSCVVHDSSAAKQSVLKDL